MLIDVYYESDIILDTLQISKDFGISPTWIYVLNLPFNIHLTLILGFLIYKIEL